VQSIPGRDSPRRVISHMTADGSAKSVRVNKLALVLLTWLGSIVGLAPVTLFLDRPRLLLYIAAGSMLSAVLLGSSIVGSTKTSATNSPSFLEFLLGGLSAIYLPAAGGIASLVVYGVVYGVAWLLGTLIGSLGLQAQIVPWSIAYYPTAVFAVLIGIGSGIGVERLQSKLYPDVAGIKSAFYDLISRRRGRLVGCTAPAVLIPGVTLAIFLSKGGTGTWFYVLLQVYLSIVSIPLWLAGELPTRSSSAIRAVRKLLEANGYQITLAPRTGDEAIDPLLMSVDLFAYNEERALALQVKTRSQTQGPVDWTAASTLQNAAWTLDDVSEKLGLTSREVEPLLVLIGAEPDDSLKAFSEKESVQIAEIPEGDVTQIVVAVNEDDLREMAGRYLGLTTSEGDAMTPGSGADAPGGQP